MSQWLRKENAGLLHLVGGVVINTGSRCIEYVVLGFQWVHGKLFELLVPEPLATASLHDQDF